MQAAFKCCVNLPVVMICKSTMHQLLSHMQQGPHTALVLVYFSLPTTKREHRHLSTSSSAACSKVRILRWSTLVFRLLYTCPDTKREHFKHQRLGFMEIVRVVLILLHPTIYTTIYPAFRATTLHVSWYCYIYTTIYLAS